MTSLAEHRRGEAVTQPRCHTSKGQNSKRPRVGVRKSLLIQKPPTEKTGDLMEPKSILS